jgi:hypothetical protein
VFSLGVLRREENGAPAEMHVLDLNPNELPDAAAQFVDDLEHQLVGVVVDAVKELLELVRCQIADDLTETFVSLYSSGLPAWVLPHAGGFDRR